MKHNKDKGTSVGFSNPKKVTKVLGSIEGKLKLTAGEFKKFMTENPNLMNKNERGEIINFLKEVERGQFGELKSEFIFRIRKRAKEILDKQQGTSVGFSNEINVKLSDLGKDKSDGYFDTKTNTLVIFDQPDLKNSDKGTSVGFSNGQWIDKKDLPIPPKNGQEYFEQQMNLMNKECTEHESEINYMQIIEQTDEEKMVMYMKLPKKKIVEMLIQCNKILDTRKPSIDFKIKENLEVIENNNWEDIWKEYLKNNWHIDVSTKYFYQWLKEKYIAPEKKIK